MGYGGGRRRRALVRWSAALVGACFALAVLALYLGHREPGQGAAPPPAAAGPAVLVVQTHRNERYDRAGCTGADRIAPGPKDVTDAAAALAVALRVRGIAAVHDAAFGADPAAGDAYARVRPRLQSLVDGWPSLRLVVDVHRDSLGHRDATALFHGGAAARLLWVVGSRPARGGADWWPNLQAAGRMTETLQRGALALVRGIWVKPGPYNQDLGPVSVLIELGGAGSCPAEVARSVVPLADAVAAWLRSDDAGGGGR